MSCATAKLLILAAFTTGMAAAAEPDCSAWTLDGYRIGMTVEDASAVRPSKRSRNASVLLAREKGTFNGKLWFSQGELFFWEAKFDELTAKDLVDRISLQLGTPAFDAFEEISHGRNDFLIIRGDKEDPPDREAGWLSPECDTAVYVKQEFFTAGPRLVVQAFLVQLSRLEKAIGGPANKVPSWFGDD